jgi:hypothetical protein
MGNADVASEDEIRQLENFFAARGLDYEFHSVDGGWLAIAGVPGTGLRAMGTNAPTRLEAMARLRHVLERAEESGYSLREQARRFQKGLRYGEFVGRQGEISTELVAQLAGAPTEFGWKIGFTREPDGSFTWAVLDFDGFDVLVAGTSRTGTTPCSLRSRPYVRQARNVFPELSGCLAGPRRRTGPRPGPPPSEHDSGRRRPSAPSLESRP